MEERAKYGGGGKHGAAKLEIEMPVSMAECFALENTVIGRDDIRLIVRAMKNESMMVGKAVIRDRLVRLALIFERIVNEKWEKDVI